MANKAIENGILAFNLKITPSQIQKERFVDLLMCFNCYALENHPTKDCPNLNSPKKCSECSGDHDYRQCTSNTKKCLNCQGPHRTMAMSCPQRKKLIAEKTKEMDAKNKEQQQQTFATMVQKSVISNQKKNNDIQTLMNSNGLNAMIMILDAHFANVIKPGSYNTHLNQTLKLNNLAPIKVLDNPDSELLFKADIMGQALAVLKKQSGEPDSDESTTEDRENEEIGAEDGDDSVESDPNEEHDTDGDDILSKHLTKEEITPQKANNLGVKIFVEDNKTRNLEGKEIKRLFTSSKLKYQLTSDTPTKPELVEYLITKDKLTERKEQIHWLGTADFKKIKSGTRLPLQTERDERKTRPKK